MKCETQDCDGHMVALADSVELESGLMADVPALVCVGCDAHINCGPKSDLMLKWAKLYVRQAGE